ncbi:NUDIX domain-containing protein [Streptomyces sp. NPDC006514]|uniref:NUDIX domain-containing protein n=1 Tax=Streptomyces sp. NPDC006514 TaxID=3154308 RepID=UPI0033B58DBC
MSGTQRHTEPLDVHLIAVRDGAAGPEVLLSRRAGNVYAPGCWHLVSGHLDGPRENMVTALAREAREESGVVVDPADVRAAVTVHHRSPTGGARIGVCFATDLAPLETVPTHGDSQPRYLRWDEAADALYVIDFERPEEGPPVRDFVRLSDAWHGRPDLFQAVMDGYGRRFTPEEEAQLTVLSVLDAGSGISHGTAHGDPELVKHGLRTLSRLRTAQRP